MLPTIKTDGGWVDFQNGMEDDKVLTKDKMLRVRGKGRGDATRRRCWPRNHSCDVGEEVQEM